MLLTSRIRAAGRRRGRHRQLRRGIGASPLHSLRAPPATLLNVQSNVYSRWLPEHPLVVGGGRNNRGMSVALAEPVDVLSSGLAGVREMLPGLADEGILRALRNIETHLRQTARPGR